MGQAEPIVHGVLDEQRFTGLMRWARKRSKTERSGAPAVAPRPPPAMRAVGYADTSTRQPALGRRRRTLEGGGGGAGSPAGSLMGGRPTAARAMRANRGSVFGDCRFRSGIAPAPVVTGAGIGAGAGECQTAPQTVFCVSCSYRQLLEARSLIRVTSRCRSVSPRRGAGPALSADPAPERSFLGQTAHQPKPMRHLEGERSRVRYA